MNKQKVHLKDLGIIGYGEAWDYQNQLVDKNLQIKACLRDAETNGSSKNGCLLTNHHLLFCEHTPVYTLGKSGHMENVLLSDEELKKKNIDFFKTNRGGDITFHGPQQVVGYPLLDLERFSTDLGKYLRNLEEVIIKTIENWGLRGDRSKGETGVWLDPQIPGQERKICAMGIRCTRWLTMHGFALNVNTDLSYFGHIIPCGITGKQVTSMEKELGKPVAFEEVKRKIVYYFEEVFDVEVEQ